MPRFVSVGECMIEMSGGEDGQYRLGYAGDTLNTAWYARARLPADWEVDYVTALGDDLYSQQMVEFFADNGIGIGHIQKIDGRRPGPLPDPPGRRRPALHLLARAVRRQADGRRCPARLNDALAGADIAYFSGISLAILAPRGRGKLMQAIHRARQGGARVAFDPNERPALWTRPRVMGSTITAAAILADIVLPTFPDEAGAVRRCLARSGGRALSELGRRRSRGQERRRAGLCRLARVERLGRAASRAPVSVDPTGAGDSFNGAYLAARAQGASPLEAAAAGACARRAGHRPSRRAGAARDARRARTRPAVDDDVSASSSGVDCSARAPRCGAGSGRSAG